MNLRGNRSASGLPKSGLRDRGHGSTRQWGGYRHVEDGDCAKFAHCPLFFIALERGVDRVCKFSDDGDCPSCSWQRGLFGAVDSLFKDEKCEDDGGSGEEKRGAFWEEWHRRGEILGGECARDLYRGGGHRKQQ